MKDQIRIELTQLRFFSYHGLYAEEKRTGNEFIVNVAVNRDIKTGIITDISETLHYGELYELVKEEMQKPRELLETLAMEIVQQIHLRFEKVKRAEIEIIKPQLPIESFSGAAAIKYAKDF